MRLGALYKNVGARVALIDADATFF